MSKRDLIITGVGVIIGAVGGYAYYHFIGCASGTCPITSKPLNATLYGSLMGGLLFNIFIHNQKNSSHD
ncbi:MULTISPECIES: DUF6132 family protein [Flavobacterium]|uniref:DUF6132 family protein n=1 Tax=Flavobacterium TaxID=237 RepID=UPI00391891BB